MKLSGKTARMLSVALTVSLLAGQGGMPVSAAKKMSLNKTKLNLEEGKSATLKVKNNKKKVKWSTSKKKVATVSAKGKVVAKSKGNAVITAKVGKLKFTCKVTVTKKKGSSDKNNTGNAAGSAAGNAAAATAPAATEAPTAPAVAGDFAIEITAREIIQVTLKAAQPLAVEAFTVSCKKLSVGEYVIKRDIFSVSTDDNTVYQIELAENSYINPGDYVKVEIATPTGVISAETVYSESGSASDSSSVFAYSVGRSFNYEFSIYPEANGYAAIVSVNVPEGITYSTTDNNYSDSSSDDKVHIKGSFTKPGKYTGSITAKDELGNTFVRNIVWLVGDEQTIVADIPDSYKIYNKDSSGWSFSNNLRIAGGSGSYVYEYVNLPDDLKGQYEGQNTVNGNNYNGLYEASTWIGMSIYSEGEKSFKIKITDANNPAVSTETAWNIHVAKGYKVTGTILDGTGSVINGNNVDSYSVLTFINKDKGSKYSIDSYTSFDYNDNGDRIRYCKYVTAGTYNIKVTVGNASKTYTNVTITGDLATNLAVPNVYPVRISGDADNEMFGAWKDEKDNRLGSGNMLYLKNGSYTLKSSYAQGTDYVKAETAFSVSGGSVAATARLTRESMVKGSFGSDNKVTGTLRPYDNNDGYILDYYKFTPSETADYIINVEAGGGFRVQLITTDDGYWGGFSWMNYSNDDEGYTYYGNRTYSFSGGKDYYIGISSDSSSFSNNLKFNMSIEKIAGQDNDNGEED